MPGAHVLIIGQAPGSRVHASGVPWDDDSGDRLRQWTAISKQDFYDPNRVALMPMGLCYPGKASGGDLPPRPECAPLWHPQMLQQLQAVRLTLLVGQYAQARYLPAKPRMGMAAAVRNLAAANGSSLALPHPAWRSRLWMVKNQWFEAEVFPLLRRRIADAFA